MTTNKSSANLKENKVSYEMVQGSHTIIGENRNFHKAQQQIQKAKQPYFKEVDEFSFTAEHIEDEPSIHIRSLTEFQNILKRPTLSKENVFEYGQDSDHSGNLHHPIYETFESGYTSNQ
jgi:hypothetical protein